MPQDNNVPQIVWRPHTTKRIVPGQSVRKVGEERTWTITMPKIRRAVNHILHHTSLAPIFAPKSDGGYGGGSFGGAGAGGNWETETPARVKDRKVSVVAPTVTTVNKQPVSTSSQPKPNNKRRRPVRRQPVEQPTTQIPNVPFNPVAVPINTEFTAPEIIETPQIQQEPIHYTRKMVRDYLRAKGEHPYDYGAFNRRALRHYLNGDKPIKQKYYRKIQDTVAAPYKDNNTPVTTLTDLGDIFLKRND